MLGGGACERREVVLVEEVPVTLCCCPSVNRALQDYIYMTPKTHNTRRSLTLSLTHSRSLLVRPLLGAGRLLVRPL